MLVKTAPYILLTYRRVKTHGRLLIGARYCFPRGRLSPRQREPGAGAKAASPVGWGIPDPQEGGHRAERNPPHILPLPARRHTRGRSRMAGLGKRGPPRAPTLSAVPCHAVLCRAVPCRAVPYLRPPGASCEKGGPGAPAGADGERGCAGAGLSGGQAVAATCAQPSLRRRLKTDIKAAGGEERGGQRRAGGAAPPDAGRSAHPPACSSISLPEAGGEEADTAARGRGRGPRPRRRAKIPAATLRHRGCLTSVLIVIPCRLRNCT